MKELIYYMQMGRMLLWKKCSPIETYSFYLYDNEDINHMLQCQSLQILTNWRKSIMMYLQILAKAYTSPNIRMVIK